MVSTSYMEGVLLVVLRTFFCVNLHNKLTKYYYSYFIEVHLKEKLAQRAACQDWTQMLRLHHPVLYSTLPFLSECMSPAFPKKRHIHSRWRSPAFWLTNYPHV